MDDGAVLIVDCTRCADSALRNAAGRQEDGLREWTARFRSEPDPDRPEFDLLVPLSEDDLLCPSCGERGRVYAY